VTALDEVPDDPQAKRAASRRRAKIALIGARRVRQGLGPYVARHLVELGAEVPCFLGTRPESVAESERALGARGYLDLSELIAKEKPDALAILSPSETHERYLEAALAAGLPVLCDKPLLWNGPGLAARAARLVERFAAAGLLLRENCQWPYTLPAYHALHPDVGPLASFAMRLSPSSQAPRQMLGDALPHPFSLLQALTGAAPARATEIELAAWPGEVRLRFAYRFASSRLPCEITLRSSDRLPREAAYAVNGRWAERRIRPSDYSFRFGDGEREVPAPDPLREMLRDSLAALRAPGAPPADPAIPARMALLEQILEALPIAGG
jgi:predicted dehydrogenase